MTEPAAQVSISFPYEKAVLNELRQHMKAYARSLKVTEFHHKKEPSLPDSVRQFGFHAAVWLLFYFTFIHGFYSVCFS